MAWNEKTVKQKSINLSPNKAVETTDNLFDIWEVSSRRLLCDLT